MTLQILFGHRFVLNADIGLNVFNEDTGIVRYQGIFGDSQFNGQFLALGSFAFLILKPKTSIKIRYLNYGFFSLGVLYILLAGSRSAMGGFIIGLLFLFIFSELRIKIYGIILGVFAILSLYLIAPNNGIFSRADRMGNDLDFRQSIWQEAFEIIKEHPLFGIGLGNFQNYTLKYHQDLYLEISPGELLYFTQPENGYLTILVEQGGIVFAIFCLFFLTPIFNFLNSVFRRSIDLKALYIVAALGSWLTAFNTVYSLSDYRIELTVIMYLFLLIMITSKNNSNHFMNSNL